MKGLKKICYIILVFVFTIISESLLAQSQITDRIITNPLNLNYRFQKEGVCRREAADPVIILYKDNYYLFASHSSGYWYSGDLKNWDYVQSKNLKTVEAWAPAVMVYNDAVYYLGMGEKRIYKSSDPQHDQWEEVDSNLTGYGDPALFVDHDKRVYLYYGCSDNAPIKGFEIDPNDGFRPITEEFDLIPPNANRFGWEVPGDNNEKTNQRGWNEAPCVIRKGDYYYLQYSSPGTEFTTYCTPVYVSKNPLGPYEVMEGSPFAIKPGGFITGAGHGHPFKDKYGNDWYVGSMIVAAREHFERRIGIFPAFYNNGYSHAETAYFDFPFIIPDKKIDFSKKNISTEMNLLSYGKSMKSSSSLHSYVEANAADENIKTWWSAATGKRGEWLQMDLGKKMKISALQICFADEGFNTYRSDTSVPSYQYQVEYSEDGIHWKTMADRSANNKDQIYELIALEKSVEARFVRVTNMKDLLVGYFSIADMRFFGDGKSSKPEVVSGFKASRDKDKRRVSFSWNKQIPTTGYVIRWGHTPNHINNAAMVYGTSVEFGFFDSNLTYYFTIEAFNESGKGKTSKIINVE